jgi:vancomycin resistance protein YoaR
MSATKTRTTPQTTKSKAAKEANTKNGKLEGPQGAAAKRADAAKKAKKPKAQADPKKLSALDAAAKVLGEAGQPMNCQEMIQAMAAKGYWTSPGGKTPSATLYSGILRELKTKGKEARFQKTERGKFALGKAS